MLCSFQFTLVDAPSLLFPDACLLYSNLRKYKYKSIPSDISSSNVNVPFATTGDYTATPSKLFIKDPTPKNQETSAVYKCSWQLGQQNDTDRHGKGRPHSG